jgi:hypothetical protein
MVLRKPFSQQAQRIKEKVVIETRRESEGSDSFVKQGDSTDMSSARQNQILTNRCATTNDNGFRKNYVT